MTATRARDLFFKYAAAVAYVAAETPAGDQQVGTAFHVGDNMWVTARHIVDGNKIDAIATTTGSVGAYSKTLEETGGVLEGDAFSLEGGYRVVGKPMLHPDQRVDVAVLCLEGPFTSADLGPEPELWGDRSQPTPVVQLGDWLDDWLGDELTLEPVLVMGYLSIPVATAPLLAAARAEVNAVLDRRDQPHPYFILSAPARNGFGGALALTGGENALGVASQALVPDASGPEPGYFAVLSVQPIYVCLDHHGVMPAGQEFAASME